MRGIVAATCLVAILLVVACTPDVRLVTGNALTVAPPKDGRTVYERRHEQTEAREMRWLGRSRDEETGFKEHLVGWRGPGTTPRKAVVPYPLVVYDGPYRFRAERIFGGFYRTPWGGYCWNYNYRAEQRPGVMNMYRAFACQDRRGRWIAYKNQRESPAGRINRSQVNLQRLIQQMLR